MDEDGIGRALGAELRRPGAKAEVLRARAMAQAVQAVRGGATLEEAAARAGVAARTVQRWRHQSPAFAAAYAGAVAESDAPMLVVPRGGVAKWQLQRSRRRHRFTPERKAIFLAHFALTCDQQAAANAAGVCVSTVNEHRRRDADFAAEWRMAKEQAYEHLDAEMARQRIAALERMRERGDMLPDAEAAEFDRALQLLREHNRSKVGAGAGAGVARAAWDFDKTLDALEKKLRAFGVRIETEEAEDGSSGEDGEGERNPSGGQSR